jgi:hypothetical protein
MDEVVPDALQSEGHHEGQVEWGHGVEIELLKNEWWTGWSSGKEASTKRQSPPLTFRRQLEATS